MKVKEADKAGKAQLCKTFKVILLSMDFVCKANGYHTKGLKQENEMICFLFYENDSSCSEKYRPEIS